jgi:putative RecB family exonuclease
MTKTEKPLSPSSVNTFLNCSARWHYGRVRRLPDPPSGSLVRGKAVDRLINYWFRFRMEGLTPDGGQLAEAYDEIWEGEAEGAAFGVTEDVDELKASGEALASKYLAEAAPEIEPAQLAVPVAGAIAGVPVRGYIDLIDVNGCIVDFKTSSRKPSGVSPDYALQMASYAQLAPGVSGEVRLDTIVATKQTQLVTIGYQVSDADRLMTERIYPHVQAGMRSGFYAPNRGSNLCSRKHCPFADACLEEFGGHVS